ncbi:hypothetical protein [uncultured Lacinutrix sp.]|uniref:hypothetical protein n=1 Tax=uncultured Lacinutrix sp. TaxID=574032 RepID=UPI0026198793|nr:hypothetical protein [uncultured Lacinutrix sp.]
MKKTSALSAIISALSILISTIIDKVMAFYAGSEGLVLVAQFKNVFSISRTFANGALNDGVVKYTSEFKDKPIVDKYIDTALKITLIASVVFGLVLVVFSKSISELVLFSSEYYYYFIALGVSLPIIGLYDVLMSIILGFKDIKTYFSLSIKTLVLSLGVTAFLTYFYSFEGAVFSIILQVVFGLIILIIYAKDYRGLVFKFFKSKLDINIFKGYSKFFLITISVMVISPLFLMAQREIIVNQTDISIAGYWQAMFRIYCVSVVFIQTTLRRFLLPDLSSKTDGVLIKKSINKTVKLALPVLILMIIGLSIFKEFVIEVLFSKDFFAIKEIFEYTLFIGVLEILSWVFSVWMISKGKHKAYFTATVLYGVSSLFFTFILIGTYNLKGILYAFLISKTIKLIYNYIYYKVTTSRSN